MVDHSWCYDTVCWSGCSLFFPVKLLLGTSGFSKYRPCDNSRYLIASGIDSNCEKVISYNLASSTLGVVGTWWFVPSEASNCWSSAIRDSFVRATTFSFGSVCFGSFLVALVQTLRAMHRMAHENDDCNMLGECLIRIEPTVSESKPNNVKVCIIDCILGCIESMIEYLNKWVRIICVFVYIQDRLEN